jgi:hypothetical protein
MEYESDLRHELLAAIEAKKKAELQETIAMSYLGKVFISFQKTCAAHQRIIIENCKLKSKLIECGQLEFLAEIGA